MPGIWGRWGFQFPIKSKTVPTSVIRATLRYPAKARFSSGSRAHQPPPTGTLPTDKLAVRPWPTSVSLFLKIQCGLSGGKPRPNGNRPLTRNQKTVQRGNDENRNCRCGERRKHVGQGVGKEGP